MKTKIILLLITGLPGLLKLLSLFVIKYQFDNETLGIYINDIAIVFTITLFSSMGWSALLLKLVPLKNIYRSIQLLYTIFIYSLYSCLILLPLLYMAYVYDYIFDINGVIILLFTVSIYYIIRHFLLARREYFDLLVIELSIPILFVILFVLFNKEDNLLYITAFSFISSIFYFVYLILKLIKSNYKVKIILNKTNVFEGLQFSLNNFISGGVINILPVVFMQLGGVLTAGFIGVLLSLINSVMLIPRAVANFKIVSLGIAIKNKNENNELKSFRKVMFLSNLSGFIFGLIISFILINYDNKYYEIESVYTITIILLISMFISSQNMVEGNFLFLKTMQMYNIYTNLVYFTGFASVYFFQKFFSINRLDILVFGLLFLSIGRYMYLVKKVNFIKDDYEYRNHK